jgi:hypothetical protein
VGRYELKRSALALVVLLGIGQAAAAHARGGLSVRQGFPANARLSSATSKADAPGTTFFNSDAEAAPGNQGSKAEPPAPTHGADASDVTVHSLHGDAPSQAPAAENPGACPAAQSIERRLSALRAPAAEPLWYRVDVQRAGDAVTVRAVTASGETWLRRDLPAAAPCEELEQAAAVVLFAWEAQLPPGAVPVPQLEKREDTAPAPQPVKEPLRVSARGQAWLSAVPPTGGGGATAEWRPTRLPLALALDVFGQGQRSLMVGAGTGTWSRLSFALGLTASLSLDERVSLTFGVGAVTGMFSVFGSRFQASHTVVDWDAGVMGRALLYLPGLWKVRPFVGADAVVWVRKHELVATGLSASQLVLPGIEVAPCAGLAWTL